MGRSVEMSDKRIFETVTLPWVVRKLHGDAVDATIVSTSAPPR
jgi:hypothetical protein